jgi:DNA primase
MARIPDSEIERLKVEVSLVRLVEASGIKLEKRGADHVAPCPFHEDDTPSFVVTPAKNLYHCFGCGAAGGPIDWVMQRQKVSFRHAVELLKDGAPAPTSPADLSPSDSPVKRSNRLPSPVRLDVDDQALLDQVVGYYHETLKQSPEALAYLQSRGLDAMLIERFRLGYANRTLGLRLPEKTRKAGAEVRTRLERIGVYRDSGHEHFNGSLVVPVIDEAGRVREVYGRKIRNDLRPGTPKHLYLPGPHRGVWNIEGVAGGKGEVILAESLIDAMTFWSAGYRNVTAAYGTNGFTDDHLSAFKRYGVERVLIAYDRDDAGEKAAVELAERLMAAGLGTGLLPHPVPEGHGRQRLRLETGPADQIPGHPDPQGPVAWPGQDPTGASADPDQRAGLRGPGDRGRDDPGAGPGLHFPLSR